MAARKRDGPEDSASGPGADDVIREEDLLRGTDEIIIPLVREEVSVAAQPRETRIRIHKSVESQVERIELPLRHEGFEVRRVPVNRVIDEAAGTRTEDGVMIIPVMAERVVTRKELVLLEEIHLVPQVRSETYSEDVTLRTETVSVERIPGGEK
jgi:stress response protein YsnF